MRQLHSRKSSLGFVAVLGTTDQLIITYWHQIQVQIEAHFISDTLRGHDSTEMRITLIKYIEDEMPPDDE